MVQFTLYIHLYLDGVKFSFVWEKMEFCVSRIEFDTLNVTKRM